MIISLPAQWKLCELVSEELTPYYSPEYKASAARLLFWTGYQESRYEYRRQLGSRFESPMQTAGAWGCWQVECISIRNTLAKLSASPNLFKRVTNFLFNSPHATSPAWSWDRFMTPSEIAWLMMSDDRWGCVFSRLHYLWFKEPIPETLTAQSSYWKRLYNTAGGAGKEIDFLAGFQKLYNTPLELPAGEGDDFSYAFNYPDATQYI